MEFVARMCRQHSKLYKSVSLAHNGGAEGRYRWATRQLN
jgi:hypothetical protein